MCTRAHTAHFLLHQLNVVRGGEKPGPCPAPTLFSRAIICQPLCVPFPVQKPDISETGPLDAQLPRSWSSRSRGSSWQEGREEKVFLSPTLCCRPQWPMVSTAFSVHQEGEQADCNGAGGPSSGDSMGRRASLHPQTLFSRPASELCSFGDKTDTNGKTAGLATSGAWKLLLSRWHPDSHFCGR